MESYSLGKLTKALGIPMTDRHRANGDALATVTLFKLLLDKDLDKAIVKDAIKIEQKSKIAPNLNNIIDELPSDTGVYYIHNVEGDIIYIGKSKNIRKRIVQHFTGTNSKSKKIQKLVSTVTYEKTGSELAALLKESAEIKKNKPIFNRALRRSIFTHALYSFTDENGYINLEIDKADREDLPITTFSTRASGKHFMFKAVEDFNLCQKLTGLYTTKTSCFKYEVKECNGACINEESAESYNERINLFKEKYNYDNKNMLIIDKGRKINEKVVFLIENGVFRGMGFFNLNLQINNRKILKSVITPMTNDRDSQHIIQSYLRRNKRVKIVDLNKDE
jgi:DNA polymerase-3 subunit epsilon